MATPSVTDTPLKINSQPGIDSNGKLPGFLKAAALWYAKHGYYVFPLWPGTKKPATPNGLYDATTDLDQIRAWWTKEPRYNIGINCGASGLLVVDADTYKQNAGNVELAGTVKVDTAHHGAHHWFKMPAGKHYGNATGTLPEWLDIRGVGGYVVAPPSILLEDGAELPYRFVPGHKPTDMQPADLPADIAAILEAAQVGGEIVPAIFSEWILPLPDLSQWPLSDSTFALLHNGAPVGADRSAHDQTAITALVYAGATDDEIRSVFAHLPIGEKYREKRRSGDKYLARSIGKARAWVVSHPLAAKEPDAAMKLAKARGWVRTPGFVTTLREKGMRRVSTLVPFTDSLLETAQKRATLRVVTSYGDLADPLAIDASTAYRYVTKLKEAGLLNVTSDERGTLIDLTPLVDLTAILPVYDPTNEGIYVEIIAVGSTSFLSDHRSNDEFSNYPYAFAIKRREAPTVLMRSLGPTALLLWEPLQDGGTVKDLAEVTGLTVAAIRATLKRYEQAGLLVVWEEGRAKWYELHPNAEERLEERREHMVTAGIGQLRVARNASQRATYAQRKLQGRMPLERWQRAKLERRRDKADAIVVAIHEALDRNGINPYTKVVHRQPRLRIKIDHGEEWVSIHRPINEQWEELAPLPYAERYRMMMVAGYERNEIDSARFMAGKMGRGPRQFVGVAA